jgi:hypothetical protein
VWVNGHEWAKRQATRHGITFTALGNGFAAGDQPGHAVVQHISVLIRHELVDQLSSGHPVALGHRGVSFVDPWTDRRS